MNFYNIINQAKKAKAQLIKQYSNRKIKINYCHTYVFASADSFMLKKVKIDGFYEKDNIEIICSLIKDSNGYFFDVGANIGLISIPVLYYCKNCQVISFEPSPNSLKYLKETVEASSYKERWSVVDKAVSNEVTTREFALASQSMGAYDGFIDTKRRSIEKKVAITTTTIDEEWKKLDEPQITVIKIDVEGAELEVLEGGINCIEKEQPSILLEWNPKNLAAYKISKNSLLKWAQNNHYRIYSVPNLVAVSNSVDLEVQMLKTENFILVPDNQDDLP